MGNTDSGLEGIRTRIKTLHATDKVLVSTSEDAAINGQIWHATHPLFTVPCKRASERKRFMVKTPPFTVDVAQIYESHPYRPELGVAYYQAAVERVTVKAAGCWVDGVFYAPGAVVDTNWVDHPFLRELTEEEEIALEEANLSITERLYEAVAGDGARQAKRKKKVELKSE